MFDFLRDLRKSDEEKRQEALSAYLDDALTPAEKERFERRLAADEALRASLADQRLIKASLSRLPQVRAPRNFTLDPALYGRPAPGTAERLYPIMRVATAVVAILFVVVLVIDLAPTGGRQEDLQSVAEGILPAAEEMAAPVAGEEAADVALEAEMAPVEEVAVEVTRIVEAEEEVMEMAAEEAAPAEALVEEEAAAEMAAELPAAEEPAAEPSLAEAVEAVAEEVTEEEAAPPGPDEASGGGAPPRGTPMAATKTTDQAAETIEGQAVENQATGAAAGRMATEEAEAPATAGDGQFEDDESQQAPVQAAPTPADEDGLARDAAGLDSGLATSQVLAIGLALLLLALVIATLLLRRRAR